MKTAEVESRRRVAWRPEELARATGVSRRSIYAWIATGELPASRVASRTLLVLDEDWKDFLQKHRTGK